jgi:hypothetical protein
MDADSEGQAEVTALWRARILGLSTDAASDLPGAANDDARVDRIRERYCSDFMALPGVVSSGMTRLWVWAEHRGEESSESRGVLDGALSVGVLDVKSLPRGLWFVEGVPVVARVVGVPRRVSTERLGSAPLRAER